MITWLRQINYHANRRLARIWKRGGYFERVRSVQTTLTRIFIDLESVSDGLSKNWDEMSRKARKFKGFFLPKLGNLQKKKKGLRQNSEWFFGRNPEFKGFFLPKSGDLKKKKKVFAKIQSDFSAEIRNSKVFSSQNQEISKKKKSSPKFRVIFLPISQIQTFEGGSFRTGGGSFRMGGLFSIFHRKSASKAQKTCDFAYFTSQWGARAPPAPPWLRYCMQMQEEYRLTFKRRMLQ